MTTVSPAEGYRVWARTYDDAPNPIVSLIDRYVSIPLPCGRGSEAGSEPRQQVSDRTIVIDVGCGTGRWLRRTGGFGIDLCREMLERCPGRVAQADASRLPFRNGIADVTLCVLALAYISPIEDAVAELHRITKPGGAIIAADLHPDAIAAGWTRSFRDGDDVYQIQSRPWRPEGATDLYFGDAERAIYERAGRADLFERIRATPAAWIKHWRR